MKEFICQNCGATMVIEPSACRAYCRYCGAHYVLNQEDTDFYLEYYRKMQQFLGASQDVRDRKKIADELWEKASTKEFVTVDDEVIEIAYLRRFTDRVADTYVARNNIIFHFHKGMDAYAQNYRKCVAELQFPPADVKDLKDFFPKLRGGYALEDGSSLLVIEKQEEEYPLSVFGKLMPQHMAWVMSRLENLACVLEYNGIVHPRINADTIFINPFDHTAMLYVGFEEAGPKNSYAMDKSRVLHMEENLLQIRQIGLEILAEDAPRPVMQFLKSKPLLTAYQDFEMWDKQMLAGFGERHFHKFEGDEKSIYSK